MGAESTTTGAGAQGEERGIKIEKMLLHTKSLITTPGMRITIKDAIEQGQAEAVEIYLDITDEGLILGIIPDTEVASYEEWSIAASLMSSQLSFRGVVDNQAIMRMGTQIQVLSQQLQALVVLLKGGIPKGAAGGAPQRPSIIQP
jgi:hypothetical protein